MLVTNFVTVLRIYNLTKYLKHAILNLNAVFFCV